MTAPVIVLATDFGLADAYVGMMRGVIAGINPAASVIDLTHGIGPQDIRHGAAVLADAFRYFPPHSIFVAVVDPGVGTERAAILLETPDARFLAPDNGLLTLVCRQYDAAFGDFGVGDGDRDTPVALPAPQGCQVRRLTNPDYWRHPVSLTFHGRDIFAPVAAHLSLGAPAANLGTPADTLVALPLPAPRPQGRAVTGQVIYADAFGNLITDLTADILAGMGIVPGSQSATVTIAGHTLAGVARTFHDPPGTGLRALVGSHGRLEIAVVDGSAAALLSIDARRRTPVAAVAGAE